MAMTGWQPGQYLKFGDERTRAARDLLAQVPLVGPRVVYDLGCGPGNSTALLVARYPEATVTGIDNSEAMLAEARSACRGARFAFGDLADWRPGQVADLLFSNAALHWVPGHLAVLERLADSLPAGGVLAVQIPDNLAEPSHRLMCEVAERGPWAGKLARAVAARDPLPGPRAYHARLRPLFRRLDIWHTVYNHPLAGAGAVVAWLEGAGLRPYLDPLDTDERAGFLAEYEDRIARAYPADPAGTVLFRFPRLFLVAIR
jgi:trans-aconitate 2-methyltransferase